MSNETENEAARQEIVSFTIGEQSFCIEIDHVLEIRGWTQTTVLPHSPDYVIGMMNLRGTVLPVVDLSLRLGLGKTDPQLRHVIIIAQIGEKTSGLLVDSVSDILTVSDSEMQATPDVASEKTAAFIRGVYTIEDTLVRAVDIHQLLPTKDAEAA